MKKDYPSWEECVNLREVKVKLYNTDLIATASERVP